MMNIGTALTLVASLGITVAQPFLPNSRQMPLGNVRTTDQGGPYNFTFLDLQVADVKASIAARNDFTDADIVDFLTNVECLEGLFDTWGTFGRGFIGNLSLGGPTPIGARKANLTEATLPFLEEIAINEQGHALITRHMGGGLPCPAVDFTGGFNDFLAAAYGLNGSAALQQHFDAPFDPFASDVNFVLSMLTLEELGATGNKGLMLFMTSPVLADAVAGLATSATAQAAVERFLLWQMRNETIQPFNETAQQVFARISALRDSLDGPQFDDQGLVNTDPRIIAVPDNFVNLIPTGIHGVTFSRTPQMIINILTLGSPDGKGAFFPDGLLGRINSPAGFSNQASGLDPFPAPVPGQTVATQAPVAALGKLGGAITTAGPFTAPGETDLTQALGGTLETVHPTTRGLAPVPAQGIPNTVGPPVVVATDTAHMLSLAPAASNSSLSAPSSFAAAAAGAQAG